ncbi:hypothetical protein MLD38_012201 [Melastoma candidum]|uniref:Uncharacterized protein n=1 Tax=Melastoma candidum TaxID=119954 RepID=A0ACB9R6W2_9MYRT|nr:hypothetical protein MLD38_012201 [Melastoma candidum]
MSKMANSRVPKFGEWGTAAEAGYTVCFDQARKGRAVSPAMTPARGGGPVEIVAERNPAQGKSSPSRARGGEREGRGGSRKRDEKTPPMVETGNHVRHFSNFPPVNPNIAGGGADRRWPSADTRVGEHGQGHRSASPLHEKANAAAGGNHKGHGGGGRDTNDKQPGRPARRPGTGGAAVPKFGDWDMKARAGAGDGGYTVIFNQARAEKHKGASPAADLASAAVHPDSRRARSPGPTSRHRGCCMPW